MIQQYVLPVLAIALSGVLLVFFPIPLMVVGLILGAFLGTGRFGFTQGYVAFFARRDPRGAVTSMVTILVVAAIVLPLTIGALGLPDVGEFVQPISVKLFGGAAIFGVGMTFAGTCSSGAIRRCGNMQLPAVFVVSGMLIGGTYATFHYEWWTALPGLEPIAFGTQGYALSLCLTLLIGLGFIAGFIAFGNRAWREAIPDSRQWFLTVLFALAVAAVVWILNHPWGITMSYPVVGTQFLQAVDAPFDFDFLEYWLLPGHDTALEGGWANHSLTQLNLALVVGALLFTTLISRAPWRGSSLWATTRSLAGGLLMGYGGVLAFGCNISGLLGGVVSASLHGWVWLVAALVGVGVTVGLGSILARLPFFESAD